MTLKEFKKILEEDKELLKKFKQAMAGKDDPEALSKICTDFGYDVPASEFALEVIGCQELDDEELESVAGGRGYTVKYSGPEDFYAANWGEEGCVNTYEPISSKSQDCDYLDFCYSSFVFYPQQEICKFDYNDTDCYFADFCDFMFVEY